MLLRFIAIKITAIGVTSLLTSGRLQSALSEGVQVAELLNEHGYGAAQLTADLSGVRSAQC